MTRYPHSCVVLAVDSAERSGWSLWSCGVRINSGECSAFDHDAIDSICRGAVKYSYEELPKVLVIERAFGGTQQTVEGLGVRRGAWVSAWLRVGNARRRIVSVYPQTWRAPFGITGKVDIRMQRALLVGHGIDLHREPGPDEFEALLIGLWGLRSLKVGNVLPKKWRAAA